MTMYIEHMLLPSTAVSKQSIVYCISTALQSRSASSVHKVSGNCSCNYCYSCQGCRVLVFCGTLTPRLENLGLQAPTLTLKNWTPTPTPVPTSDSDSDSMTYCVT